jgi:hypothetical protein
MMEEKKSYYLQIYSSTNRWWKEFSMFFLLLLRNIESWFFFIYRFFFYYIVSTINLSSLIKKKMFRLSAKHKSFVGFFFYNKILSAWVNALCWLFGRQPNRLIITDWKKNVWIILMKWNLLTIFYVTFTWSSLFYCEEYIRKKDLVKFDSDGLLFWVLGFNAWLFSFSIKYKRTDKIKRNTRCHNMCLSLK